MQLVPGTRLGVYEIVGLLGAGGMGEVYRAVDTRLDRHVALKVLPEAVALDPERTARFQREAKVLASLNHPHIAALFGLEEHGGRRFLAMELVDGETLAERIARGPVPVDEAMPIARQIAEAVEAAHDQGIIHRDLKPANIKIRPDGAVKVLDFGLAKALTNDASASSALLTNSPTITSPAGVTGVGILLGTAAYMSPEQARGKPVDKRADVWAFGCVLFEMLTGRRPFDGHDVTDTIAAVVRAEPEWSLVPANVPARVRGVLKACLHKDVKERLRDVGDVRLVLNGTLDVGSDVPISRSPKWGGTLAATGVVAALVLAIAALVARQLSGGGSPATPVRLTMALPPGLVVGGGNSDPNISISSDGNQMAFVTDANPPRLYVRPLDQLDPRRMAIVGSPRAPFWSHDGKWIGYIDGVSNLLTKVAVTGGPATSICEVKGAAGATGGGPRGASWGADNSIIFATNDTTTGLLRVSADGGTPEVLTTPNQQQGEADHFWPEILPGGNAVLFTIVSASGSPDETARSIEGSQIAVLDLRTRTYTVLIRGGTFARYAAAGYIVYISGDTLRAVPFDADRLALRGDPVPVVEGVAVKSTGAASFAVAQNGTLLYLPGGPGDADRRLAWIDRQGREEVIDATPRPYISPRISPDGKRVAVTIRDQDLDIWVLDLTRGNWMRRTFDPGLDTAPLWTPDGTRLVFTAQAASRLFWQLADGTGSPEVLVDHPFALFPLDFSHDGGSLVVREGRPGQPTRLGLVSMADRRYVRPLMEGALADLSPDGRWIAYQSNESGQLEIHVRPFPDVDRGRWQVSTGGGMMPAWAPNGHELFYLDGPRMMAVSVEPGPGFAPGHPRVLFERRSAPPMSSVRPYDLSADGQRFLMISGSSGNVPEDAPPQLVVVQNWTEELKRLVPTR